MQRHSARQLALPGILTAVLLGGQVALAALPNVEIVSLLVILYSLLLGRQVLFVQYEGDSDLRQEGAYFASLLT